MILRATLRSFLTVLSVTGASFLLNVLTARALGPEGRGHYSASLMIIMLAAGLAQFGLAQALVVRWREAQNQNATRYALVSAIVVALLAMALAACILSFNGNGIDEFATLIAVASAPYSVYLFTTSALQLDAGLALFNVARLALPLAMLCAAFSLYLTSHLSASSLLSCQLLLTSTIALLLLHSVLRILKREGNGAGAQLRLTSNFGLGIKYHSVTALGLATGHVDKLVLLSQSTAAQFGIYSVSYASSRLLGMMQDSASAALFAANAGKLDNNPLDDLATSFRLTFYPLTLLSTGVAAASPALLSWVFGEQFQDAAISFSILCFECVIGSSSWLLAQYYQARIQPGRVLLRQTVALIPVIVAIPFIPQENAANWLATALLASSLLRLLLTVMLLRVDTGFNPHQLAPRISDISLVLRTFARISPWKIR